VFNIDTSILFKVGEGSNSDFKKTDCHDIAEILLKVALNTTKQTSKHSMK
jgi:hypothetical protein